MQITSVMKQTQQEILPKRVMGIEPTCSAWKADILPLNYTRIYLVFSAVLRRLYYYTTSQNKCQYFFEKKSKKFLSFLRLRFYRVCIVKNNRHPAFIRMPVNFYFSIFTVISLPSSPTVIWRCFIISSGWSIICDAILSSTSFLITFLMSLAPNFQSYDVAAIAGRTFSS